MAKPADFPASGGCACRSVRYRLKTEPMFVHCCHCRWCQRETGASYALNAMIEMSRVEILEGEPELTPTPTNSGRIQKIMRCPTCRVALWSHYPGAGDKVAFIRSGTLDDPDIIAPDIHIYTSSKQPWVVIPDDAAAVPEFYDLPNVWPPESFERLKRAKQG